MDEPQLDDTILRELIGCRDRLLWLLADQHPPPEPYSQDLWQAHALIAKVVEEIKEVANIQEPLGETGWTIYPDEGIDSD